MEWGPRALGNRSILADPTDPNIKNVINSKIKKENCSGLLPLLFWLKLQKSTLICLTMIVDL